MLNMRLVVQVTLLKRSLQGICDVRSASLLERDWVSLLKSSRKTFIVPDSMMGEGMLQDMEEEKSLEACRRRSSCTPVTGSPPQVGVSETAHAQCGKQVLSFQCTRRTP
jgi:hypothetical protein